MASFLFDHNVIRPLVSELRRRGHTVLTAQEARLDRADDRELLIFAGSQGLIVVTGDSDFAELHRLGRITHEGILLIRPLAVSPQERPRVMADVIEELLASNPSLGNHLHRYTPSGWAAESN